MPSYTIPQGVLVRVIWALRGSDWAVNVFGAINPSALPITQTLTNTVGASIKGFYTSTNLKTSQSANVQLRAVGLRDISVPAQPEYIDTGAPVQGTGTGDLLPSNVSFCVTIRTSLAGRRYRGRAYIWGAVEGQNDGDGQPVALYATQCVAFVNGVGSALSSAGMTPAVLSRAANAGTAWSTAVSRQLIWTTQRRRLLAGI